MEAPRLKAPPSRLIASEVLPLVELRGELGLPDVEPAHAGAHIVEAEPILVRVVPEGA